LKGIAITGGVASGKTTVAREFERLGAYVVSCDSIVHRLLSPQHPIGQQVINCLGPDVVRGGALDRAAIANRIFHDPSLRKKVEAIIHPAVWQSVQAERARCPEQRLFVVEAPLLFEADWSPEFDTVICVKASLEDSREWAHKSGMSAEEFDRRERAQLPREEKARRANYRIVNLGDRSDLLRAAEDLYTHLTQKLNEPRRDRPSG
jgi:dephospho-CoA kinase